MLGQKVLMDPRGRQASLSLLDEPGEPGARIACPASWQPDRRLSTGRGRPVQAGRRFKTSQRRFSPGRENRRIGWF
jgi:hypothetical protein